MIPAIPRLLIDRRRQNLWQERWSRRRVPERTKAPAKEPLDGSDVVATTSRPDGCWNSRFRNGLYVPLFPTVYPECGPRLYPGQDSRRLPIGRKMQALLARNLRPARCRAIRSRTVGDLLSNGRDCPSMAILGSPIAARCGAGVEILGGDRETEAPKELSTRPGRFRQNLTRFDGLPLVNGLQVLSPVGGKGNAVESRLSTKSELAEISRGLSEIGQLIAAARQAGHEPPQTIFEQRQFLRSRQKALTKQRRFERRAARKRYKKEHRQEPATDARVMVTRSVQYRYDPADNDRLEQFYQSREWKLMRYEALRKHGGRCQCCGASPAEGKRLNVDHIYAARVYWDLRLDINNLQVLCEDCNEGKGARHADDWRETASSES